MGWGVYGRHADSRAGFFFSLSGSPKAPTSVRDPFGHKSPSTPTAANPQLHLRVIWL